MSKPKCWYCGKGSEEGTLTKIEASPYSHEDCWKSDRKFKVNGQEINGPDNFFYKTDEDPIMLAALFELAFATGNREGYAEAVADFRKVKP